MYIDLEIKNLRNKIQYNIIEKQQQWSFAYKDALSEIVSLNSRCDTSSLAVIQILQ